MRIFTGVFALIVALCMTGCATTKTVSVDPNGSEDLGIPFFTPVEIDKTVTKWLDSMVGSEPIASSTARPIILFGMPDNRTDEHVDMQEFQSCFEIHGTKSGKIRFSSVKQLGDQIIEQMKCEKSALFDQKTVSDFGKMKGWRYSLFVELYSPTETMQAGRKRYHFYRAVLKLVENETGLLEWSEEAKFLKMEQKQLIGR